MRSHREMELGVSLCSMMEPDSTPRSLDAPGISRRCPDDLSNSYHLKLLFPTHTHDITNRNYFTYARVVSYSH